MKQKLLIMAVVLVFTGSSLSFGAPGAFGFSGDEMTRLMSGEVFSSAAVNGEGIEGVKVAFVVEASKKDVWNTITDYNHFHIIFGDVHMKVIDEDRKGARVKASMFIFNYIIYHRYDVFGERVSWYQESGDLKFVEGSWQIKPTSDPAKQLVLYENYIDAGNSFYNWLAYTGRESRGKSVAKKMRRYVRETYVKKQ